MAAQGTIKDVVFDSKSGIFKTNVQLDTRITEPTLLHVFDTSVADGDVWYANGYELHLMVGKDDVSDKVEVIKTLGVNKVGLKASDELNGKTLNITIGPKTADK